MAEIGGFKWRNKSKAGGGGMSRSIMIIVLSQEGIGFQYFDPVIQAALIIRILDYRSRLGMTIFKRIDELLCLLAALTLYCIYQASHLRKSLGHRTKERS